VLVAFFGSDLDRSSVRQQWLVPSAELTFVIGRQL